MTTSEKSSPFPSFVSGEAETTLRREIEEIANAVANRRAQFLFGAGMSASSGVPSGYKLATKLLSRVYPTTSQPDEATIKQLLCDFPLECVAESLTEAGGKRIAIQQALREEINKPEFTPNKGHEALRDICSMNPDDPFLCRIYTTNFDLLIEEVFGYPSTGKAVRIHESNDHEMRESEKKGKLPVVHLHGTLEDLNFILTETDVEKPASVLMSSFEEDLSSDTFVFVGYGLRDPDIRRVFFRNRQKMAMRPEKDRVTYVVSSFDDDRLHAYMLAKRVWKARGATLIPMDAAAFMILLRNDLENRGFL